MEKRLGIEEKADFRHQDSVKDLVINVYAWKAPVKIGKHYISNVVFVEDKASGQMPFIEYYPASLSQSQIKGAIKKFKKDPLSFRNQLQNG